MKRPVSAASGAGASVPSSPAPVAEGSGAPASADAPAPAASLASARTATSVPAAASADPSPHAPPAARPAGAPPLQRGTVHGARRVTMTDVAQRAGVSQSTVSLALNRMPGVRLSDATRQRVFDVAAELGYRLPAERALQRPALHLLRPTQRTPGAGAPLPAPAPVPAGGAVPVPVATPLILYLVDEISTSPHPVVSIDGAKDAAWEQGAAVAVAATRSNAAVEAALFDALLGHPGLVGVVYSAIFTRRVRLPEALRDVPTVLLNCYEHEVARPVGAAARRAADAPALPRSSIVPAELAGGHAATERLIEAGHRRIAFLNGEPWMDAARDRLKGYRRALASHDIAFDAALVREGDWQVGTGHEHTLALMRQDDPPTAVFCANDLMAVGCLEALRQLGRSVPGQVSVMGYDDQEISRHTHPPLSTLVLPSYEMGRLAVETLLAEVADPQTRRRHLKVEGRLVERETVGPAPRRASRGG